MATIYTKPNNHLICVDGTKIPIDDFCITQYHEPELIDITTFGDLPSKVFIKGTDEFCVEISIKDCVIKNSYTISNIVKGTKSIYFSNKNEYKIIPDPLFVKSTFDNSTRTYIFNFIGQKIIINNTNVDYEKTSIPNKQENEKIAEENVDKVKNRFQLMDI